MRATAHASTVTVVAVVAGLAAAWATSGATGVGGGTVVAEANGATGTARAGRVRRHCGVAGEWWRWDGRGQDTSRGDHRPRGRGTPRVVVAHQPTGQRDQASDEDARDHRCQHYPGPSAYPPTKPGRSGSLRRPGSRRDTTKSTSPVLLLWLRQARVGFVFAPLRLHDQLPPKNQRSLTLCA